MLCQHQPVALEDEFDFIFPCLAESDATKALSAKAFLATEQRIVGLGNGVLQDTCGPLGYIPGA